MGCTTEKIVYVNVTNTVIEKVPTPCPVCPPLKKCPDIPTTVCNTTGVEKKLLFCNIWLDQCNDRNFEYMQMNTSQFGENLTIEYDRCIDDKRVCENRLDNISNYVKGLY